MYVSFTGEYSLEINSKFNVVNNALASMKSFFSEKKYGDDLSSVLIGLCCVSPKFEDLFTSRKPKYRKDARNYIHKGTQVASAPHLLTYDIRLPFDFYIHKDDIRPDLAQQVLRSLDVISTIKQITDFDLPLFKADFEQFFKQNGWL
jgi:hypothetical protein